MQDKTGFIPNSSDSRGVDAEESESDKPTLNSTVGDGKPNFFNPSPSQGRKTAEESEINEKDAQLDDHTVVIKVSCCTVF